MLRHLPKTWDSVLLDCLTVYVLGGDWGKNADYDDPDYVRVRCIRASELRNWESEYGSTAALRKIKKSSLASRELRDGDIVVEVSGGGPEQPVRRTALINSTVLAKNPGDPKICTNFFRLLRSAREMNSDFLNLYLKFFYKTGKIAAYQGGSNNLRNLKFNDYLTIRVPIPPAAEQHRIVEEIERRFSQLDAGVAALERAKANLKNYRASVLQAACEGRLVPTEAELARTEEREYEPVAQLLTRILKERRATWEAEQLAKIEAQGKLPKDDKWRAKYKEPAGPDTNELPELPEGWILASLEQITSANRVICYGILMPKENVPDGIPYVRVKDMKGDRIDLQALHRTAPEIAAAYARASLKPRDVLLAIRGTYGRVAEVPNELDGGNITQDTARLAVSDLVYHRYVSTLLRSPDAQNYFKRVARGVAVKGVNIADVKLTPIMLPPLPEQLRIVTKVEDRLSILDKLEVAIAANLKRAGRLRQAILKQAFEGKLVPQDPNDEPARVLLERIREERARKAEEEKAKRKPARKKKERKRGVLAQRMRPERDVCLRAVSE